MTKINYAAVAKRLRKSAKDAFAVDRKRYAGERDMIKMLRGDFNDTMKIADLIEKKMIKRVHTRLGNMDTGARDECGAHIAKKSPAFYNEHFVPEGWVGVAQCLRYT